MDTKTVETIDEDEEKPEMMSFQEKRRKYLRVHTISKLLNFREEFEKAVSEGLGSLRSKVEGKSALDDESLVKMPTEEKIKLKSAAVIDGWKSGTRKIGRLKLPSFKLANGDIAPLLPLHLPEKGIKFRAGEPVYDIQCGKEALFVFRVYRPFFEQRCDCSFMMFAEIVLRGTDTLDALCDKIVCEEGDMEVENEKSCNYKAPLGELMKERCKSRALYFGDNIYVDGPVDYSANIRTYVTGERMTLGKTLQLKETRCLDLVGRIGFPYVYMHLGCCEHLVRLIFVRLATNIDCLESELYPFYNNLYWCPKFRCWACLNESSWIVTEAENVLQTAEYFCDTCLDMYLYNDKGEKIGNFNAYRYVNTDREDRFRMPKCLQDI